MNIELKRGRWKLSDLLQVPSNGLKVFSCFHCGGGSTMGYKLAGYEVLGGVEIDEKIMALYRKNMNPKHSYHMPVQEFNKIPDSEIPPELFNIDVLDGSPPCTVFSMAGKREELWGQEHHFREGQAVQILDDLFFHFIDAVKRLKPKTVVAENVKGLIAGDARGYVKEIFQKFNENGYDVQLFLLNSARMGVPQSRERTFFLARRRDLNLPKIDLKFNEPTIPAKEAVGWVTGVGKSKTLPKSLRELWDKAQVGHSFSQYHATGSFYNNKKADPDLPVSTLTATVPFRPIHWAKPEFFSDAEILVIQSFPDDYDFIKQDPQYVCGMSVPPFMMQRVSVKVAEQWFGR